jgi:hypothetical protein
MTRKYVAGTRSLIVLARADYLRALRDAASYGNPTAGDRKQLGRQHGSEYQFCGDQRQDELQQLWRQAES